MKPSARMGAARAAGAGVLAPGSGGKRRGDRRRKEAWRKNVDINDVEEFLDDQRLEERLGKFSEKSDSELFAVDTTGNDLLESVAAPSTAPVLSSKRLRRAALSAVPRCYQHLEPDSKVPDPNKKRNTVTPAGTRPTALSRLTATRRAARGTLQHKQSMQQEERERVKQLRRKRRTARGTFDLDVWTQVPEAKKIEADLQSEWMSEEATRVNVACDRRVRRPPRAAPLRPPPPPVPPPHPGQSYNPSYQDHQDLLRAVCEKETQLIKKEKHLERVTTRMYKHVRSDKAQSAWLEEMMAGLPAVPALTSVPAAADSDASGDEYSTVNPPVRNRKKDARARRKQREQRELRQQLLQRKQDKKKIADLYKLRFLEGSLRASEARLTRVHAARAARRSARLAAAPPTLNAHKHTQHDEDFLAPAELAPALRAHTQQGNLLKERFDSLQRRGALAPSRVFLRKKLRLKRYFKPGHKVSAHDIARYTRATAASTQLKTK